MNSRTILLPLLAAAIGATARAEVRLPAVLSDDMVLQRGMRDPVWGWADPGEAVTVSCAGRTVHATADAEGRWTARLPAMKAGGPYDVTIASKNTITLHNVLVGEVWVASGQSNMEFGLDGARNAAEAIAGSDDPQLRLFTVQKRVATEPATDCAGHWAASSPQTSPGFSAVAYFFGRHLRKTLGVPVGLIHTSWGGTPAEAWTRRQTLTADPQLKGIPDRWDQAISTYSSAIDQYNKQLAEWQVADDSARASGQPEPKKPDAPQDPKTNPWLAGGLYNGMIAPLVPFGIKGAIWYQGESNADRAYQYRDLFATMIRDWRDAWGEGPFPFLFVQLANFMATKSDPGDSAWAELREAQRMALAVPHTGMATIIDIGEAADIHPKDKLDVGERLGLAAEGVAYGRHGTHSGPSYRSMKVEGRSIRLRFDDVDGGLQARDGEPLKGFAIAGEDRKFVWADATISGDSVIVHSDAVERPVAVRYAWADNPAATLVNTMGLPASPFRTDDWPGVTRNNR